MYITSGSTVFQNYQKTSLFLLKLFLTQFLYELWVHLWCIQTIHEISPCLNFIQIEWCNILHIEFFFPNFQFISSPEVVVWLRSSCLRALPILVTICIRLDWDTFKNEVFGSLLSQAKGDLLFYSGCSYFSASMLCENIIFQHCWELHACVILSFWWRLCVCVAIAHCGLRLFFPIVDEAEPAHPRWPTLDLLFPRVTVLTHSRLYRIVGLPCYQIGGANIFTIKGKIH